MAKLTATFSDRDSADLALMRLRRRGVDFQVLRLDTPSRRRSTDFPGEMVNIVYPYGLGSGTPVGSSNLMGQPTIGARALLSRQTPPEGEATLCLAVRANQLSQAREILRSAGGRGLTSGT